LTIDYLVFERKPRSGTIVDLRLMIVDLKKNKFIELDATRLELNSP